MGENEPIHFEEPAAEFVHRLGNALFAFETAALSFTEQPTPDLMADIRTSAEAFFQRFNEWQERFPEVQGPLADVLADVEALREADWSDATKRSALVEAYHALQQRLPREK